MTEGEKYNEDYFLRGKKCGVSLYESYSWRPELTIPMMLRIADYLDIYNTDAILDYGCSRGYLVKAFREEGYNATGIDISEWAIDNCDPEVKAYVKCTTVIPGDIDWIIAKDVLEHVDFPWQTIDKMLDCAETGVFVVVPLSNVEGRPYVVPDYEKDVTHIHRLPLWKWASFFMRPGWEVTASYRVVGVKDNYAQFPTGNGFITARRIEV